MAPKVTLNGLSDDMEGLWLQWLRSQMLFGSEHMLPHMLASCITGRAAMPSG